ncbi:unnamed protein product [Urochloa humidicola]
MNCDLKKFCTARSVRVGNGLGAGNPRSTGVSVFVSAVATSSPAASPCCQVWPAVGCGWQATVAYINIGCYYLIGLHLGFKFDFGVKGLWGGMIGGTLMQTLVLIWITFRIDWNREVEEARKRLDKWDGTRQPLHASKE